MGYLGPAKRCEKLIDDSIFFADEIDAQIHRATVYRVFGYLRGLATSCFAFLQSFYFQLRPSVPTTDDAQ